MTISRQKLYAAGEPMGESATRREAGRVIYGGGGGSSSSSATTSNTTDKRMVVDQGVGVSSDSSTVNVTALDAGAIQAALDFAKGNDAAVGEGFTKLLDSTGKMIFSSGDNYKNLLDSTGKMIFSSGDNYKNLLNATDKSNTQLSGAFGSLLNLADKFITASSGILDKTATTTLAQVSALNTAQNDAKGAMDQKTMITLGITAAVGIYAVMGKK